MNKVLRHALTGSAIATGMMAFASPAQADCVVTPAATPVAGSVVCGTTVTTDTTYTGVSPSLHRNYNVNTSATPFTGTVSTGAAITGAGLAFTQTVAGTNAMTITNNGSISATSPVTGGNGALSITSIGSPITYTGTGSITNLGVGNGLDVNLSGTGSFNGTVSGNVTSGTGSYPDGLGISIDHTGTAGNITLSVPVVTGGTTIQGDFAGIGVVTNGAYTGTVSITNNAAITSRTGALGTLDYGIFVDGLGTGGVSVTNNGAIGSATDRVLQSGIRPLILNAASTATLSVTGSGAIWSAGTGIDAINQGTGTTTVNYTGPINTTGGTGVQVVATTGPTNVTLGAVTAATNAVSVSSTGAQTITLNGVTTGTAGSGLVSTTSGARTITVGTAGNVTGGTQAILLAGTGATTIQNNGIIGAASTGLALNNTGTGAVTLTNGTATVHTPVINGRLTFNAGADTFTNNGVWNTQGTTDFGAGADTLNNAVGATINITGATTFANLETLTLNGLINIVAGGTLTGTGPFTIGATGELDTAGSATLIGFNAVNNNGLMDLAAGTLTVPAVVFTNTGTIEVDEGVTTIAGQTSFVNNGTIDLVDGAIGDSLIINSNYTGVGTLQVDVSGNTADTLVINGTAGGQTAIDVNTIGLGVFDTDGILVVDVSGASDAAFVMGEELAANPLINFDVAQIGNDYFLITLLDPETAFIPVAATGMLREMWYQSADEVFAQTLAPTAVEGLSIWADIYGSQRRTGTTNRVTFNDVDYDADNNIELDRWGIQGGIGYGFGLAEVGVTLGYADAQSNGDGEFDANGWNIGLYGRYGGLTGFHAEALFKHDSYDIGFDDLFDGNDGDGSSTGVDGSIGYRFPIGIVPSLDVFAGLSHVWSDMDGVSAFGFDYDFDDMTSTRGRLGVRGNFGGDYNPYLSGALYHEFSGDGDITLCNGSFCDEIGSVGDGTWARIEGGIGGGLGTYGLNIAAWADFGDTRGAGIRAGYRWGGAPRMAEAAYVPPPPPPAPAPATQTCADGSVILATEACPPPPPPPPPAAPGERGL